MYSEVPIQRHPYLAPRKDYSTIALDTSSSSRLSYQRDKWKVPGKLRKSRCNRQKRTFTFCVLAQAVSLRHDPRSVPCQSVWDLQRTVTLAQVFLRIRILLFPPVSVILPMLYTPLCLETILTKKTSGRRLGTFKKHCRYRSLGTLDIKILSPFLCLRN